MLLTLPAPPKAELDLRHPHDFPPPLSSAIIRPSADLKGESQASLPASASNIMSGPHRGLPPPAAMNLPDPSRPPPPAPHSLGHLPAPPQWQGAEDAMRNWLFAKAEEEKRRQEEERTRQETLRLEQRKVEQQMLQDSMRGGIPPPLVPLIFAGIGGSNLANLSLEWLQQYLNQLQVAQQHQHQHQHQHQQQQQQQQTPTQQQLIAQPQMSPGRARDTRYIAQTPSSYGVQQPAPPPTMQGPAPPQAQPLPSSQQHAGGYSTYPSGPLSPPSRGRLVQPSVAAPGPTSAPRQGQPTQLPRLTTNEMQIQTPPSGPPNTHPQTAHVAQQDQSSASPSIYFHHWVPPTAQAEKKKDEGHTTSSATIKRQEQQSHYPTSHISDIDYTSSPKRRKTQSQGQGPAMQQTSPAFSQASSSTSTPGRRGRAHSRTRSDVSSSRGGYDAAGRPMSRHDIQSESGSLPDPSSDAHRSQHSPQRGGDERVDSGAP